MLATTTMPENVGIRKIVKENCACHEKWQNSKDLDIEFMKTSLRQDFILPKSSRSAFVFPFLLFTL